MGILFGDMLFFIILTWYFDRVIESNRGRGESPLFPFIAIKNLFFKPKEKAHTAIPETLDQLKNPNYIAKDDEESAVRERQRVYSNSAGRLPALGLRIKDLSKTFKSYFSSNSVQAINHFNLEI